ncbi:MAG: diguanylate cyclase [candidate division Zixibacteria bacterium]|nr:diguanylate cyclase [candidate division Zixibacteria bacterium]
MKRLQTLSLAAKILVLGGIYFCTAKLGLSLAFFHPSASPVWPPTGLALAALLVLGYRVWPGIFLGAFWANVTTFGSLATSLAIAFGNTLEGLIGAYLVNRLAGGQNAFERPQGVFKFSVLAGIIATTVSATFGITSLSFGGFADWTNYWAIWVTWWLGDMGGALVVAPLLILWGTSRLGRWRGAQVLEGVFSLGLLFLAGQAAFGDWFPALSGRYPMAFLTIPIIVWIAFRFGQRETATAVFLLAGMAVWGTLRNFGQFVMASSNESLLVLQMFIGVVSLTSQVISASVTEHRRAGQFLRSSEKKFRAVVEHSPSGIVTVSQDGKIVLVNSETEKLFGYARDELIGKPIEILVPGRFRENHPAHRADFFGDPQARAMGAGPDLYGLHKDGREIPVEIGLNPIRTEEGLFILTDIVDITERKRLEEELKQANERLTLRVRELELHNREVSLLSEMGDLLQTCLTLEEAYRVVAPSLQKLFPNEPGALCMLNSSRRIVEAVAIWGEPLLGEEAFEPENCWALRRGRPHVVGNVHTEVVCRHLSHPLWGGYVCMPMMAHGEALGLLHLQNGPDVSILSPVRRELRMEALKRLAAITGEQVALNLANLKLRETLSNRSIRDSLTGLFNRRYLEESLERELSRARRNQQPLGTLMLDLDHFKRFNDTFGHKTGDELLKQMGEFLLQNIRGEDIACRYGGDEFMLILPGASLEVAGRRAEKLEEMIKGSNGPYGRYLTLSIGIAVFLEHGTTKEELLRAADFALYRAKHAGGNRMAIAQPGTVGPAKIQ